MPIISVPSAGSTASEPMNALAALPGSLVAVGSAAVVGLGVGVAGAAVSDVSSPQPASASMTTMARRARTVAEG